MNGRDRVNLRSSTIQSGSPGNSGRNGSQQHTYLLVIYLRLSTSFRGNGGLKSCKCYLKNSVLCFADAKGVAYQMKEEGEEEGAVEVEEGGKYEKIQKKK